MTRPNVDFSQLRAMVFCREVRNSDTGVTLIDIHDTRFSPTFPMRYEELFMYLSFEVLRRDPVHAQLQVMRPGSTERETFAETVFEPDESLVVVSPLPMVQFEFDRPGTFNFGLYVDGALVGSSRFTIESLASHRGSQPPVRAN